MTLGQRVAVLDHGVVQQVHTPSVLYDRPANLLRGVVHREPGNDFLRVHTDGTSIAFATHRLPLPEPVAGSLTRKEGEMILGFRPEHFSVTSSSEDGPTVPATVEHTEQLGSAALVDFRLEDVAAETLGADSEAELAGAFVARLDSTVRTGRGQQLKLAVDVTRAHFFDLEDDRSLWSPS